MTDNDALENIYNYIIENKKHYVFERDGIYFSIKCDIILKVVEINITGYEMQIMVDDGVEFYSAIFSDINYSKKFLDLIQSEFEHTENKKKKYGKNNLRRFYSVVKKLKK